jgi:nitroimidazol reductase NimA-like FMN-containing flavoprotein (pyridoxamine 5'-phosphate oxidase superfamily)
MTVDSSVTHANIALLLNQQQLATLATMSQENPYCNLVAFTPSEDLQTILFSTPRQSTKYANIVRNPNVALLIDSRTQFGTDVQAGTAVTALGSVVLDSLQTEGELRNRHAARHEQFKDFIYSPDCALVQIRVQRYIFVSSLRDVRVLEIST